MIIKIRKGKHSPLILFRRLFSLILYIKKEYKISHVIEFPKKSYFEFEGNDKLDFSKILGISFGHHLKNESYRFAFRMLNDSNINIGTYYYIKSRRFSEFLCDIDYDRKYIFSISFSKKSKEILFEIIDQGNNELIAKSSNIVTNYKLFGYKLWPYIGGNNPSPIDFFLYFK
jgi:hypothetical protein